jgi:hypothetical protein
VSLADDFLRDAGAQGQSSSLADQFVQDASGPATTAPRKLQPPEPLSFMDKMLAKVPTGLVNNPAVAGARSIVTNAAAPIMGGAQLLAHAISPATDLVAGEDKSVAGVYDRKVNEMQAKEREARSEQGPIVGAANEFAGSMISPANLAMGANAGPAVTTGARAFQGAKIGAAAGATSPVEVGDSGKYWGQKGAQTVVGTTGGAVLTPLMGAIGDRILARTNRVSPADAAKEADDIISGALADAGQKLEDIPPDKLNQLRKQTVEALSKNKRLDAAAALRMQDFKAEGIQPLEGQITRDPGQWAEEQNVRGVKGAGEKVQALIAQGNQTVSKGVGQYGNNASEAYVASPKLADALRNYDSGKQAKVTAAYNAARDSSGKDLLIPTDALTTTYKQVLGDFEDKIPKAVQSKFDRLGFQFSFEDADKLRKVINDHVGTDPTTNKALGRLREALNTAQLGADTAGGPYAPAVKLAKERFAQQEAIPAIADAVNGKVDDKFIQRQVLNNPSTPQVQKLAALLRSEAPEAFQETRQQIGAHLARAAFGENAAGDKLVAQESYNRALRSLGTGKLEAFFEPQEIDQMKRLGRIASYQVAPPAGAASNYSNTSSAIANLLRKTGGFVPFGGGKPVQFLGDQVAAFGATHPSVPVTPNLTAEQRLAMSRVLAGITGGTSIALPSRVVGQ